MIYMILFYTSFFIYAYMRKKFLLKIWDNVRINILHVDEYILNIIDI